MNQFEASWIRTKKITGWNKKAELADFLDIKPSSVSGAKKRGTFPIEWAYKIAKKYNSSTDWIIDGKDHGCINDIKPNEPFLKYENLRISEKLQKTAEILESETIYRTALAANIDAFHHAVAQDNQVRKNEKELAAQQKRIADLESRIVSLEKLLSSVSATPGDYQKKNKNNAA